MSDKSRPVLPHLPSCRFLPNPCSPDWIRSRFWGRFSRHLILKAQEEPDKGTLSSSGKNGKVLVGGGTGFVGTEVCALLERKGYNVTKISRSSGNDRITWEELEDKGIPEGTRAIVNLAGQGILDPFRRWTPAFQKLVYDSRVDTAKAVRDAIVKSKYPPEVYVQISGVGYYPPVENGPIYDEESVVDHDKDGDYVSRLAKDWEAVASLPPCSSTRLVVVRSGVVLGRKGGMISQIFLPFYFGLGGRMGSGVQPMPWIHLKDLAGIIEHSIANKNVKGVLNGVAPGVTTNAEFVEAFATALNRPAFFPLPEFVWNLVFGNDRAAMITKGQQVVPKRTLESGYRFRFPVISEACREFSHFSYADPDERQR